MLEALFWLFTLEYKPGEGKYETLSKHILFFEIYSLRCISCISLYNYRFPTILCSLIAIFFCLSDYIFTIFCVLFVYKLLHKRNEKEKALWNGKGDVCFCILYIYPCAFIRLKFFFLSIVFCYLCGMFFSFFVVLHWFH